MQEVHTFMRLGVPDTIARTVWMFGFQRRRVRTCECDTLLPKPGPLPQTSQTEATAASINQIGGSLSFAPAVSANRASARNRGSLRSIPDAIPAARTNANQAAEPPPFRECRPPLLCWGRDHAQRSADSAPGEKGGRHA